MLDYVGTKRLWSDLAGSRGGSIRLYPTAGVAVDQGCMPHGLRVRVITLDLNRPWLTHIGSLLLSLLDVQPGQVAHPPM